MSGCCFGDRDAVEGIIAKRLAAGGIAIVGNGRHGAVVRHSQTEIVTEIDDVAGGRVSTESGGALAVV